jgi:hypothetical protein
MPFLATVQFEIKEVGKIDTLYHTHFPGLKKIVITTLDSTGL